MAPCLCYRQPELHIGHEDRFRCCCPLGIALQCAIWKSVNVLSVKNLRPILGSAKSTFGNPLIGAFGQCQPCVSFPLNKVMGALTQVLCLCAGRRAQNQSKCMFFHQRAASFQTVVGYRSIYLHVLVALIPLWRNSETKFSIFIICFGNRAGVSRNNHDPTNQCWHHCASLQASLVIVYRQLKYSDPTDLQMQVAILILSARCCD